MLCLLQRTLCLRTGSVYTNAIALFALYQEQERCVTADVSQDASVLDGDAFLLSRAACFIVASGVQHPGRAALVTCSHVTHPFLFPSHYPRSGGTQWIHEINPANIFYVARVINSLGQSLYDVLLASAYAHPVHDLAVLPLPTGGPQEHQLGRSVLEEGTTQELSGRHPLDVLTRLAPRAVVHLRESETAKDSASYLQGSDVDICGTSLAEGDGASESEGVLATTIAGCVSFSVDGNTLLRGHKPQWTDSTASAHLGACGWPGQRPPSSSAQLIPTGPMDDHVDEEDASDTAAGVRVLVSPHTPLDMGICGGLVVRRTAQSDAEADVPVMHQPQPAPPLGMVECAASVSPAFAAKAALAPRSAVVVPFPVIAGAVREILSTVV